MSVNINTQDLNASPNAENERQRLRLGALGDEQLAMLAATWDTVKDSDTPMANLRTAMSDSGLFDHLDKYATNNLELRTLASSAHDALEHRHGGAGRADELRAILGAVGSKATYADKRSALSDLLGFNVSYNMSNQDIDAFVRDAETELAALEAAAVNTTDGNNRTSNRDLANQVSDLLDGQLAVNSADQVHYGAGATALGKKVGGQYAPGSQLRDIVANADQIRDGLADRDTPGAVDESGDTISTSNMDTSGAGSSRDATPSTNPDIAAPTSASPNQPPTPEQHEPLVLGFVDQTYDAIAAARDAAEARRRNELAQGGKMKRFLRNMWKGENGLAGAYYLEKYKREELAKIEQAGDAMALESADLVARERAQLATIERMQIEYDEDAGEKRKELEADSPFGRAAKDLLRRYVSGEITDKEALTEEWGRILEQLPEDGNQELIGEGRVRINNLFAIGEQIKAMDDHEAALDRLKIFTGEARSNVRSEAKLNKTEKMIERLQQSKYTTWISPETISVAAAVALGVARVGRGTVLRAAGVTLAPGVLGGVFAGLREGARVKQEYALHSREMAQGKRHEGSGRRSEFDDVLYETADATTLITQLNSMLGEGTTPTPEEVQSAYEAIAMVEARRRVSNKRGIDLIRYSDPVKIPEERRDIAKAIGSAKVRLSHHLDSLPQDFRDRSNITPGQSADEALSGYTNAVAELDADISSKDAALRKIRHRRMRNAAAAGALTSALIGFGAQEALAFASPSYNGLAEHLVHGGSPPEHGRQTTLEGAREAIFGHGSGAHVERIAPSATYDSYPMGDYQHALELPSNYHAVIASNGTITVDGPKDFTPVEGLTLEKNGSLSPESLQLLNEHHISAIDTGGTVAGKDQIVSQNVSVEQYNTSHSDHLTHVTRDFPYDNNTSTPDSNERRLWWAGEGDKGLGKDGSTIQMSVSHMTAGGSFHGSSHVSWAQAAHDGKLKLAVSASRDTQTHVYFVDVKPNGEINIPKDDPSRKFFSIGKGGQVEFNGAYAEVVEVRGEVGGVTHIAPLATEVGSNSLHEIPDKISVPTQHYVPHVKLTPPVITHEIPGQALEVEGFGGPAIVHRRPLEALSRRRVEEQPIETGGYNSYRQRANGEYGRPEGADTISPRLEANPTGQLVLGEELEWFAQELENSEGADYMRRIDSDIQNSAELQSLPAGLRTITTIPVAAASESDNIYKTLSLYAQQDAEQLQHNAILLNVNWIDTVGNDPAKRAKIDKTFQEIERARRDFPGLHIATMTREYNGEEVKKTGGVIGYVARDLLNTALIAVHKRIQAGDIPFDADVAIVRQDADMRGLSRHYLRQLEGGMDKNPNVDIFHGTIRSDVPMQERYPGLGIVTNFSQAMSAANAAANRPWTVGINAVVRASSMAAVNGLGRPTWTGAGSDDVNIAWRVGGARRGTPVVSPDSSTGYYQPQGLMDVKGHRIVVPIPGMSVDSSADRLIPQYLMGRHFGAAWDSRVSQGTSFSDGPGGYRDRTADADIMKKVKREKVNDDFYDRIETNISGELQHANEEVARKILAIFFAGTPNAYTITGNIGDGSTKFELTDAGREFIKRSVQREVNGSRGAGYGARKMRQLYGQKRGGRRSVARESPFVAPLE